MEISLAAEKIFQIGSYPITNSLLTAWGVMIFLTVLAVLSYKRIKDVPSRFINFLELIIEGLFNLFNSVTQDRKLTKKFFPIVATIFIFVIISNWSEILPGMGSIGIKNHHIIPIFRAPSSDLNFTLGLAIASVISVQIFGILGIGFIKYIKKYINFKGPVNFFVGILELVSEFAKLISFSLRLFGNIFAGEVLLLVIAFLIPLFAPIPFYFLEIFVGFVQALIFSMLTLVFMTMAVKIAEH
ncbi:MAG: F0F1 ATP synthase subunit A [Patescibacteria group bacterium]